MTPVLRHFCRILRRAHYELWPTPYRTRPARVAVVALVLTGLVVISSECHTGGPLEGTCHPPRPAWDTRSGEEFSERDPNFVNYFQHIFPGVAKNFAGLKPLHLYLITGLLPSVHLLGLHDILILRISLQRIKTHNNMSFYIQKWVIHWSFKFLIWNLSLELNWRVALTEIFKGRSLAFRSVSFLKRQVCGKLGSHHRLH